MLRRKFKVSVLAAVTICFSVLFGILFGVVGSVSASDDAPVLEVDSRPRLDRLDRRPQGLAFVDLPMRMRARFDASYMNDLYASEVLARPFVGTVGPNIQGSESLASQFALTRSLSKTVEVGIVWGARSRIGRINLFDFERQTVGAMIRIVP
jgi:hypothetical protein